MNTRHLLPLLIIVAYACERSPEIEPSSAMSEKWITLLDYDSAKNSSYGKLGVGRYYNVSNQWASGDWNRTGDFNGDGKEDIVSINGTQALMKFSQGEYSSSFISETWFTDNVYSSVSGFTFVGDFNGDGYSDIASAIGNQVHMKINDKNGGFNFTPWTVSNQWGGNGYNVVGDFNGDGKDDIAGFYGTNAYMKLSTGYAFQSVTWFTDGKFGGSGWTFATDYDGDGDDDILSINGDKIYIKRSNGNGFSSLTHNTSNIWGSVYYTWAGDSDNDGKGEIITAIGSTIIVREWNGTNTWGTVSNSTQNLWGGNGYNWVMNQTGTNGDEVVSAVGNQIFVH